MSDLWMIEFERLGEDFDAGRIDEPELRDRLRRLGLDQDGIDEHVRALRN